MSELTDKSTNKCRLGNKMLVLPSNNRLSLDIMSEINCQVGEIDNDRNAE